MPNFTLDIEGSDLTIFRDGVVILRGRFDTRSDQTFTGPTVLLDVPAPLDTLLAYNRT
jgi:hypothetical protein